MVDSVQVLDAGFRVTDVNGNPVNNAKIKFREVGPGATKTVYSDASLTVPLGHTVRTRSDGFPVVSEGSSTTTLIFVGPDPYHIEITDAFDAVIFPAKDNVKGAPTLSVEAPAIPPVPVISTGSPLTLTADHKGNLINATGNTLTFSDAVTLGDGWHVYVRNNGSSGQVILSAASGVSFEGQSFTLRALLPGEGMHIGCDGTAFRVISHTPPLMASQGPGIIQIVDRVTAAPVGPTPGTRYIVEAGFDAFTMHQVIEATGSGFNAYTPPVDCGWVAYVQDEDRYYAFKGSAWVDVLNPLRVADMPDGTIVGRAYDEYTDNSNLTTTIPQDDSLPQSDEGTEVLSVTHTLVRSTNRVRVRFQGCGGKDPGDSGHWIAALFFNAGTDAVAASLSGVLLSEANSNNIAVCTLDFEHAPGSVGPHTYAVRVGSDGTMRLNGLVGGRLLGGGARATLVLEEIQAS